MPGHITWTDYSFNHNNKRDFQIWNAVSLAQLIQKDFYSSSFILSSKLEYKIYYIFISELL